MTYDDIVSIFMAEAASRHPVPEVPHSGARRLRDALEPIATQGWWSRPASERVEALGLDFFGGYVWGRAAALGSPAPAAVVAAFGVFEPEMLAVVYAAASATAARSDVLAARADGAAAGLAEVVSVDEATAVAEPLLAALGQVDPMGRSLFAALRELPLPTSPHGRLWRAAELVREHRGDGHLAAVVASGADAVQINVVTELWLGYGLGEYSSSRGYSPERVTAAVGELEGLGLLDHGALTPAGRFWRDELELATDASQATLLLALGNDLETVLELANGISSRIVAARSFPSDPRKRAAG